MQEQFLGLIKELTYQQALELANGNQLYVNLNRGGGLVHTKINSETHYNTVIAEYIEQEGSIMDFDCFICFVCEVPTIKTTKQVSKPIIRYDLATLSETSVEIREADFFYTLNQADLLADKIDKLVANNQPVPTKLRTEHNETLELADKLGFDAIWD